LKTATVYLGDNALKNNHEKYSNDLQLVKRVTYWGMATNILLSLLKLGGGLLVGSVALIADGVHSFSDLFTDVVVLISNRAAKRPPDFNHPYGHGKFETIGSIIIGMVLLIIGGGVAYNAISSLIQQQVRFPGPLVVIIAATSVLLKEILFQITRKAAVKINSSSLYANAWHHRSDALSSIAVLIGGCLNLVGFGHGDQIAGMVVGLMVFAVAGKIIFEAFKELSEHALDEKLLAEIKDILDSHQKIDTWHQLRTRKIGPEFFVDMHILVDPEMSVGESHRLTVDVERKIANSVHLPINVLIHVEPNLDYE